MRRIAGARNVRLAVLCLQLHMRLCAAEQRVKLYHKFFFIIISFSCIHFVMQRAV